MIEVGQARDIAKATMNAIGSDRPLVLLDDSDELPFHWIFYFNDERYVLSGDPLFDLVDSGPIAVAKEDGSVTRLNGAESPAEQLDPSRG